MSKFKFNPRIIMSINNENVIIKGLFIDHKEFQYSINKCFNNENEAKDFLDNMKERNCEFSIQVNRINWKM